jgi:hypothetical protein
MPRVLSFATRFFSAHRPAAIFSIAAMAALAPSAAALASESHVQAIDTGNSLDAVSCVPMTNTCVVSDSKGNAFYATDVSASSDATWKSWSGPAPGEPSEAVACPSASLCTIAAGHAEEPGGGNLYYATSLGGAWHGTSEPTYGVDAISCASTSLCVSAHREGYIRESTNPASEEWFSVELGPSTITAVDCLTSSFCATVDSRGELQIANTEAKIKESGAWKSTEIDAFLLLHGIACSSTTFCVAVDGEGHVIDLQIGGSGEASVAKEDIDGTNDLTAVTCTTAPVCVAVDDNGNVFMSPDGGRQWGKEYAFGKDLTGISCSSRELCVATDTEGEVTALAPRHESQSLEVEALGEGEVTTNLPRGMACPGTHTGKCTRNLTSEGTKIVLRETPASHWKFVKWAGVACENGLQTGEACEFKMPKGEVEVSAEFEAVKLSTVSVFVDGEGTVTGSGVTSVGAGKIECGPSGGPICATEIQSKMQLIADPKPGYVFAGWVGCHNEQGASHDGCSFEPTGATELIAIFLPEVKNGTSGTNGSQGEKGLPGVAGPAAPQGPAGKQGPAGRVELVTCTKVKGTQRCTTKLVSGPVKFATAAARAILSRHGHAYATGSALIERHQTKLALTPLCSLTPGRYSLSLLTGTGKHKRIHTEAFTLS